MDISEKSTEWYEGGIHEHGSDVEVNCCFASVLASAVKSKAAMWEQASPIPAMQVQCAHIISPVCFIATQAFNGGVDNLWECFTNPINTKFFGRVLIAETIMLLTHSFIKKL